MEPCNPSTGGAWQEMLPSLSLPDSACTPTNLEKYVECNTGGIFDLRVASLLQQIQDATTDSYPQLVATLRTSADEFHQKGDDDCALLLYQKLILHGKTYLTLRSSHRDPVEPKSTRDTDEPRLAPKDLHEVLLHSGDCCNSAGIIYHSRKSIPTSTKYFSRALKFYKRILACHGLALVRDEARVLLKIIQVWNSIGNNFFESDNVDSAMIKYQYALKAGISLMNKVKAAKQESVPFIEETQEAEDEITEEELQTGRTDSSVNEYGYNDTKTEVTLLVASTLQNVARVHSAKNQTTAAMASLNEALRMYDGLFRGYNPTVAETLNEIAIIQYNAGRYELALKTFRLVCRMRAKIFGSRHITVSDALQNVAMVYDRLGMTDMSAKSYNMALNVFNLSMEGDKNGKGKLLLSRVIEPC